MARILALFGVRDSAAFQSIVDIAPIAAANDEGPDLDDLAIGAFTEYSKELLALKVEMIT